MQVVRHTDPDAFLEAALPMAARGEASASFFAGAAHTLKRTPPRASERVYLASCSGDDGIGVAIQRDSGPVLIGASDVAAARAFAEDLAGDWPELQGVMGAPAGCEAFAERWRDLTGRAHRLRVRLRQHKLTAVNAVPGAPGAPRLAEAGDVDWLIEMQVAFIAEVRLTDSPQRVREFMPVRVARGDFWIWDDGARVAYVGYNDAAPDFARIAPVYTIPGARGRGYATALVAELSRELLTRGKRKLFLTTDIANPTSNAIYARIGFRPENDDCGLDFVAPVA
ncbi:MAG TPA: GNAT family N-acetyltransferase [Casimicrobiaceae bacterium]|nr:GNAT family N-acetyltransferase [Casimicrobiaceae bacterium]